MSDGPSQRPLRDNTQHSQETNIHAPGGIRSRNPDKRAAADPSRRPRGPLGSAPRMVDQNLWRDVIITHVTHLAKSRFDALVDSSSDN